MNLIQSEDGIDKLYKLTRKPKGRSIRKYDSRTHRLSNQTAQENIIKLF